ncbi:MAG: hypothetical protein UV34_C0047G0005 [Parcubacteria group bacterium GW2011_GWB1_42_6]|nr:MAG: hypothetical protein UV34_C0047G0005 [Parcubacteria group bacterium GW2011_GWB1_42_6]
MEDLKQNKISKFIRVEDDKIPQNGEVLLRTENISFPGFIKKISFRLDIVKSACLKDDQNPDMESDEILKEERKFEKDEDVFYEWDEDGGFEKI